MFRIADAMEKRADDIVAAETRNTGKPVALTASEEMEMPTFASAGCAPSP